MLWIVSVHASFLQVKWKHSIHILCPMILVLNRIAWLLLHIGTCAYVCSVAHFCPTLCLNMDCSLPDSSVHGISQARILEWVTMPSSMGPSWPRDPTCIPCTGRQILYCCAIWGSPYWHTLLLSRFSCVWLFVTPWNAACQAPLSTGFPRQEYWIGLPFPPPRDLPDPGIESMSPASPALAGNFLNHWATWKAQDFQYFC